MTPRWPNGPIACFGDSYTKGTGAGAGEDLPSLLESLLGRRCLNFGVAGETAEEGFRRIPDVLDAKPRLCIVEFGVNEAFRGQPIERCVRALDRILGFLSAAQVPAVLVGVRFADFDERFDAALADLAGKHGAGLVADALRGVLDDGRLGDGYHPNGAGYRIFAARIAPAIQAALAATGL